MPSYYGNLVDDATKRRLNTEAVQSFDTGLKIINAPWIARPLVSGRPTNSDAQIGILAPGFTLANRNRRPNELSKLPLILARLIQVLRIRVSLQEGKAACSQNQRLIQPIVHVFKYNSRRFLSGNIAPVELGRIAAPHTKT